MPSYEVRPTEDGQFEWVRLSDKGKVTKREGPFSMFEMAVADANRQDPDGPDPDIHEDIA